MCLLQIHQRVDGGLGWRLREILPLTGHQPKTVLAPASWQAAWAITKTLMVHMARRPSATALTRGTSGGTGWVLAYRTPLMPVYRAGQGSQSVRGLTPRRGEKSPRTLRSCDEIIGWGRVGRLTFDVISMLCRAFAVIVPSKHFQSGVMTTPGDRRMAIRALGSGTAGRDRGK